MTNKDLGDNIMHDNTSLLVNTLIHTAQSLFSLAGTEQGKQALQEAALSRMNQLFMPTLADYIALLRQEATEWNKLVALSLKTEGNLSRPRAQFEVAAEVITEWSVFASERSLRVLSLGCGPGFETCSLAMMLDEVGLVAKNWQVEIFGLDVNSAAISKAEEMLFSADDLEFLSPEETRKWFFPRGGGFHFKTNLAPSINLAQANAFARDSWPLEFTETPFDLIFCRGLTCDTPPDGARKLAQILKESAAETAFLFLDPTEFLPGLSEVFTLEERRGVTYYRQGVRKMKTNKLHQTRRQKRETEQSSAFALQENQLQASPQASSLERREEALLASAAESLSEGSLQKARDFAVEASLGALEYNRACPEAWQIIAEIERAMGRTELAQAISEAAESSRSAL